MRLRDLIDGLASSDRELRILDIGGRPEYWQRVGLDFLRRRRAKITLLNFTESELGAQDRHEGLFEYEVGDGCHLDQYADGSFDLAHSNSVIEHVGAWPNMKAFAAETRRVGRAYYVQTPYYWFPIDPHFYKVPFFHWMGTPLKAWFLTHMHVAFSGKLKTIDQAYSVMEDSRLLDRHQFQFLFPDCEFHFERLGGLAKSLIGIRRP
ncbi:MAG TPA: class I SAM-dependent methyltransferase [Caulobacteraceae bacterium]|nr:class I SAM-dependent methyltransferase [Caulobacteraceae bacterium]